MKLLILMAKILVSALLFWLSYEMFNIGSFMGFGIGSVSLVSGAFHWIYWRI